VVATAGACAVAAGVAFAASAAYRTTNFIRDRGYKSSRGWQRYSSGLLFDAVAWGMPGVRKFKGRSIAKHSKRARHVARKGTSHFARHYEAGADGRGLPAKALVPAGPLSAGKTETWD
jgi:coproporphyrinogen III oxidase-like Fe-S oxidoreductase